ncbi:hypothetical protein [Actinoplanes sp. NPDC026619]|uniref:dCTP deaminase n=1 Tax=Actinoplanes sp. NPDC026619 TaxID=3155798 RepID=UPI0033E81C99
MDDVLDPSRRNNCIEYEIPPEGLVLQPGRLYLAHTMERLGGEFYAPTFAARSSVARLGIFINLSASLGDIGFIGQWTLQLYTAHRARVFTGMAIGQMMWWQVVGNTKLYRGKYQHSSGPRSSDIHRDFARRRARTLLPRFGSAADPKDVGSAFAALSELATGSPAHAGFAVPRSLLSAEAAAGRETDSGPPPGLSGPTRLIIRTAVAELLGEVPDEGLCVCPSTVLADASAGRALHHAVMSAAKIVEAVERVWRSSLDAAVLVHRTVAGPSQHPAAESDEEVDRQ